MLKDVFQDKEIERLARMTKMRTEGEIETRRAADFASRKQAIENMKRNKRREKIEKRKAV